MKRYGQGNRCGRGYSWSRILIWFFAQANIVVWSVALILFANWLALNHWVTFAILAVVISLSAIAFILMSIWRKR